jgi:hypothetical protein
MLLALHRKFSCTAVVTVRPSVCRQDLQIRSSLFFLGGGGGNVQKPDQAPFLDETLSPQVYLLSAACLLVNVPALQERVLAEWGGERYNLPGKQSSGRAVQPPGQAGFRASGTTARASRVQGKRYNRRARTVQGAAERILCIKKN